MMPTADALASVPGTGTSGVGVPIWRPGELWAGATCAILASGPSLTLGQVSQLYVRWCLSLGNGDFKVVVVNDSVLAAPWADLLYAGDWRWWEYAISRYPQALKRFQGLMVTQDRRVPERCGGVHCLEPTTNDADGSRLGFDPRPGCLRNGPNSGYQALHLAAQLGVRRAILLGFDCRATPPAPARNEGEERHHWHGRRQHPTGRRMDYGSEQYGYWRDGFATLREPLAARGVDVVNCSPGTALEVWPCADLEAELHR